MIPTNASKNQATIVALFVILVGTAISHSQMSSAKNTYKARSLIWNTILMQDSSLAAIGGTSTNSSDCYIP